MRDLDEGGGGGGGIGESGLLFKFLVSGIKM
jgi:hypothetical protein